MLQWRSYRDLAQTSRRTHCLKPLRLPISESIVIGKITGCFTGSKSQKKSSSKLTDGNILATDNLLIIHQLVNQQ